METKQIQEFLTLAELGNSYAAAEKLFVSQSTLVRHIQGIEEEFGAPLFNRSKRGFLLNDAGKIFLLHARRIAMEEAQCHLELHGSESRPDVVRLCSQGKIIDLLIDFKREYPDYSIDYHKCEQQLKELHSGKVEIAFLSLLGPAPEDLAAIPCYEEDMMVVVYEGHPLAGRSSVTLEELRGERFIALCEDSMLDNTFAEMFDRTGFLQDIAATVPAGSDMMRMVQEKLGIALIHGVLETTPPYPGLVCIPLEPRIRYRIMMCCRKDVPLSKAGQHFVSFARKWLLLHKDVNASLFRNLD